MDRPRRAARGARPGFTLIELLVVIAIITLLLAVVSPLVMRVVILTRQVVCGSNQHQIITAQLNYAADNKGRVPVLRSHLPCQRR